MVGQLGAGGHPLHRTMSVVVWNHGGFKNVFYWFSKFISNVETCICFLFLSFYSALASLCCGLSSLPSLHSVLMVPGYRQVSGRIKDLFCCFGSPVSVGSQGKGWGGSTTHLCLRLVWPLSCGHAPLHYSALLWDSFCTVWYDIWCPLPLEILSLCILSASFFGLLTSIEITQAQLKHFYHMYIARWTTKD